LRRWAIKFKLGFIEGEQIVIVQIELVVPAEIGKPALVFRP
jgi:hypothetical protein